MVCNRSADFYSDEKRTLWKLYALKILIDLEGEGRQFDFFQFVIKFGATVGLFSLATLVSNLLLNLMNKLGKTKSCLARCGKSHQANASKGETEDSEAIKGKQENNQNQYHLNLAFSDQTY